MAPAKRNVTLDLKVFVGLVTALVGAGGYATVGVPLCGKSDTGPLVHRVELRDTVQALQNRYMLDSIARVGRKVEQLDRKLDTMIARQERYMSSMLETVKRTEAIRISARRQYSNPAYTMREP